MRQEPSEYLNRALSLVGQCDRCGTCLSVCPLFGVRDREASSARGKNMIARALAEGGIEPSPAVLAAVNFCLMCRTCVENCPSRVKTDEAMIEVRQHLADRLGVGAKYRLAGLILENRSLVKLAAAALSVLRKAGLNRLVPFGMAPDQYTRSHYLAVFGGPSVLGGRVPEAQVVAAEAKKVAYFQGCGMRMLFPAAARQTFSLLARVATPIKRENFCCGLPHLAHGLRKGFLALTKKNILLYEDVDLIVTDCASCGSTLKHAAFWFAGDPVWEERAAAFGAKVMDLTEYLAKIGYEPRRLEATITYHDPCHLIRGQGISKEPRQLLAAAGTFVEAADAGLCCGGAGTFHTDYPEEAERILARKKDGILKSGASVVVTGCPGCLIQLGKAAAANGGRFSALHISQVL